MRSFIPKRPSGYTPEALFDQAVWDRTFGAGAQIRESSTVHVSRSSSGIVLTAEGRRGGAIANPIAWYQFVTMNLDDMDCYTWDDASGKAGTIIIKVIKPPLLKGSLVHRTVSGVSINYSGYIAASQSRQATNPNGTVTQVITPFYAIGDLILTAKIGSKIYDLNADGRVFAGPSQ